MLYFKALHIIFMVSWFAGLFYIVRLFAYHTEAEKKTEPEKSILQKQYKIMERRLWYIITWPAMIGTFIFGWWMVYELPEFLQQPWFIVKLAFVFGLFLYHLQCHIMYKNLQKDEIKYSSFKLRLWNEVATIFLVAIVFIVILKNTTSFIWGILGLLLLGGTLFIAASMYKKGREKKKE